MSDLYIVLCAAVAIVILMLGGCTTVTTQVDTLHLTCAPADVEVLLKELKP